MFRCTMSTGPDYKGPGVRGPENNIKNFAKLIGIMVLVGFAWDNGTWLKATRLETCNQSLLLEERERAKGQEGCHRNFEQETTFGGASA